MAAEVGTTLMAEVLPAFLNRFPQIKFEMHFSTDNHNLIEEGFDLAIRIGRELEDSSYIAKRLASPAMGFFASPEYLKNHPPIKNLEDLTKHNHILMNIQQTLLNIKGHQPFVREQFQLSSNSMAFNKAMALRNHGIAVLPLVLCKTEVSSGKLQPVLPTLELESPNIFAVYPSRHHLSKALTSFIDFISDEIRKIEGMD